VKQLTSPYRFFGAEETLGSKVAAGADDAELEAEGSGVPIDNKADRLRSFQGRRAHGMHTMLPLHASEASRVKRTLRICSGATCHRRSPK
jgi:hypothetical protein